MDSTKGDNVDKCKAEVWPAHGYRHVACGKTAKRDGFCGTHHPDAVAARRAKSEAMYRQQAEERQAKWDAQHQQASDAAEAPALRVRIAELELCLARTCFVLLTDKAVTDTLWSNYSDLVTVADDIAGVLNIDTVAEYGGPSDALVAMTKKDDQ